MSRKLFSQTSMSRPRPTSFKARLTSFYDGDDNNPKALQGVGKVPSAFANNADSSELSKLNLFKYSAPFNRANVETRAIKNR